MKTVLWLYLGIALAAASVVLSDLQTPAVPVSIVASCAIIILAKVVSEGAARCERYLLPIGRSFLRGLTGNVAALIVGIQVLQAGHVRIAQSSIAGGILGIPFLIGGLAAFVGGLRHGDQSFDKEETASLVASLRFTFIVFVIPAGVWSAFPQVIQGYVTPFMSVGVALALLILFVGSRLKKYGLDRERCPLDWGILPGAVVIAAGIFGIAYAAGPVLVGQIDAVRTTLGWTPYFMGALGVAAVTNIAEHLRAIQAAWRNEMGAAVRIVVGSTNQVALFVAPVLLLVSEYSGYGMTILFHPFELVVIATTVAGTHLVLQDGKTTWFEGLGLVVGYSVVLMCFYFIP